MKAGVVVASRYRLEQPLGQGGMGEVWAATHLITGKQVAIKLLKAEKAARPELVQRFFREARAATVVGHPNVVQVHDVFSFDGAPVMVMELLEGESLRERLRREGTLSLADLAALLVPVVSAVGTAHARGIVHRDLKPENVFLLRDGAGTTTPKVLDFGIAKLAQDDMAVDAALTRTGSMIGTPFYMAPEQASGERDFDHRCDVWALGVMSFEALLGYRPFEGDNFGQIFKRVITVAAPSLRELRPDLPAAVSELLDRMLCKERDERCELSEVVRVLSQHTSVTAPTFGAPFSQLRSMTPGPSAEPLADVEQATRSGSTLQEAGALPDPEPMLGTLGATTRAQVTLTASHATASKPSRAWLAGALGICGIFAGVAWRALHAPVPEPSAATASASTPVVVASAPSPTVPQPSVQEKSAPPVTSSAPRPAPRLRPSTAASAIPVASEAPAPKRLPGGILDQEQAPF